MRTATHPPIGFNTQPPEGGWTESRLKAMRKHVSTHSRLKAAGAKRVVIAVKAAVSTHSRLKAAGRPATDENYSIKSFNTQPPEGGWLIY